MKSSTNHHIPPLFHQFTTIFPDFPQVFIPFPDPKNQVQAQQLRLSHPGPRGAGVLALGAEGGFFRPWWQILPWTFWGSLFIYGLSMVYLWIWIITVFPCFPHDLGEWTNGEVALEGGRDGELTQGLTVSDQFYVRCVDIFTGIRNSSSLVIFVSLNLFEMTTTEGHRRTLVLRTASMLCWVIRWPPASIRYFYDEGLFGIPFILIFISAALAHWWHKGELVWGPMRA